MKDAILIISTSIALCHVSSMPALAASEEFDRGFKLLSAGRYADAISQLDKSVDAEPTNGKFHFWRAKCLQGLGKAKEASAEFKLAALLATDAKLKESCKIELAKYHKALPAGSVAEPPAKTSVDEAASYSDNDKIFKLSSKKLDWNLQMKSDFLKSMSEKNARLDSLARSSGRWRIPQAASQNVPLDMAAALNDGPAHFSIPLSADERNVISKSDVCIILDHSGSMNGLDCPGRFRGFQTRLSWCVEELESFSEQLSNAFPHGFYLISFDAKPDIHKITSPSIMRQVLDGLKIGGGTDLAAALTEAFRLHTGHPQQPLLIAVLTDAEIDLRSCERTIVEATRRFPKPNGIFVSLMQVGVLAEVHTADTLRQLDNLDTTAGAAYDAFKGISFSQLRKDGLGRDLLVGMRGNPYTVAGAAKSATNGQSQKNPGSLDSTKSASKSDAQSGGLDSADPEKSTALSSGETKTKSQPPVSQSPTK